MGAQSFWSWARGVENCDTIPCKRQKRINVGAGEHIFFPSEFVQGKSLSLRLHRQMQGQGRGRTVGQSLSWGEARITRARQRAKGVCWHFNVTLSLDQRRLL